MTAEAIGTTVLILVIVLGVPAACLRVASDADDEMPAPGDTGASERSE